MDLDTMRKVLGLDETATEEDVKSAAAERGVEGTLFTQDDVNAFLKKAKLDKREADKQLADLKKSLLDDVRRVVAETRTADDEDDPDDGAGDPPKPADGDGKTAADTTQADRTTRHEVKKLSKTVGELQAALQAERDRAAEIEKQAKIKDRDSKLRSACAKVRMADPDNDWRLFVDNMSEDEETGEWVFLDADGDPTKSIEDGLREALATRKHLLAPSNSGGSGASGGNADKTGAGVAKQKLASAIKSADPHRDADIAAIITAQNEASAAAKG